MKYGEQLEQESVPQWSLHNLDYNSLKHEIKTHTTRNQATAIAIPGQQDHALRKFEDGLYLELCRQHDRVGLFVNSKADEISRRLGIPHQCSHKVTRNVGANLIPDPGRSPSEPYQPLVGQTRRASIDQPVSEAATPVRKVRA
jgi:SPX domain protein involved in polyphosphate accumulation